MIRFSSLVIAAFVCVLPLAVSAENAAPAASCCAAAAGPACDAKASPACSTNATCGTLPDGSACTFCLTKEELVKFNGKNGQPAYIAVDGVIYDVSTNSKWKNGKHEGYDLAGQDVTKIIQNKSPHGTKVLKKLKVIGKLVEKQ